MKFAMLSLLLVSTLACASRPEPPRTDWTAVDQILGRTGVIQPGNVNRVAFPRTDLTVEIAGVRVRPALALGSWAAFTRIGHTAMVMGDLVLLAAEVNAVISELRDGGIRQTGLHNHLIGESPRILYLHFSGHGDALSLARTIRAALDHTATPLTSPAGSSPAVDFPIRGLDEILGFAGKANGGVYQFTIPRGERIVEHGVEIPPSMGLGTVINFQPTDAGGAVITGDFVLIASEVDAVIGVLRSGGIDITALHNHMLEERPRLFFMHFWANDDALKLARTLRAALDRTNIKR